MCVGLSSQPRRATSTLSSRPCSVRQVLFVSVGYQLKYYGIGGFHYDLAVDDTGHTYAVTLVSFFIVTRTNISYGRYMEGRALLGAAMRSVREISQTSAALTVKAKGPQWAEWRGRVSRRAALLLRALACVLHHPDERERVLAMPCLLADEQARLRKMCPGADKMRPVLVLALWLRRELASAPDGAVLSGPAASSLQGHVNEFISSYHGLMKLVGTPIPFPLAQISLAFILCWVFTLPLALLSVMTVRAAITGVTFAITAAFVGLLKVSVELDDPFGDDPNDIDVNGMVDGVLADLRVVLDEIDGDGAAEKAGIPEAETTVLLPAPATETTGLVPRS